MMVSSSSMVGTGTAMIREGSAHAGTGGRGLIRFQGAQDALVQDARDDDGEFEAPARGKKSRLAGMVSSPHLARSGSSSS